MNLRYGRSIILALLVVSCATNRTPETDPTRNLSPEGKLSYQTMKVLKALDVLRDVAAEGEKRGVISPQVALQVLAYHKATALSMSAAPGGWKAIALSGLDQLKDTIPAPQWRQLEPFVNLARVLIEAFVPAPAVAAAFRTEFCHG